MHQEGGPGRRVGSVNLTAAWPNPGDAWIDDAFKLLKK